MRSSAAIVGGGVIGAGWAARFILMGWDVAVFDPSPDAQASMRSTLANARHALPSLSDVRMPREGNLRFADSLEDAVTGTDWIQESTPERLDLKRSVLGHIQTCCAPQAIIASSTSGFKPSDLSDSTECSEQIIVAHPFNPVYLLPLVEVVGPVSTVQRAMPVLSELGMKPLHVRHEIDAHIADRLLEAVWREALWLINDRIATTEEIDDAIRFGFGLRWGQMGVFETYRIAGGETGMAHFIKQFGPALQWPWSKLTDVPELTDELIQTIADQSEAQSGHLSIRELERIRDDNLVAMMRGLKRADWGAGALLNAFDLRQACSGEARTDGRDETRFTIEQGQHAHSAKLPKTPDFENYPIAHHIASAAIDIDAVVLHWDDDMVSAHHAMWLRENSPDAETIHPLSREMLLDPLDVPADIVPIDVAVNDDGNLRVEWSHGGHVSEFHAGWLRANAYFEHRDRRPIGRSRQTLWTNKSLPVPATFDGPSVLTDKATFLRWLEAVRDYGIARLENLPLDDGILETVVGRIGPIRETNFGRLFDVIVKDNPDSNAYTSSALVPHMDLATRTAPPGLQFLLCRANTTSGGQGIYIDGFKVAEDMRREEATHFEALTSIEWEFKNRASGSDYRTVGPVLSCDIDGHVCDVRFTPWLRAPIKAPLNEQRRAYHSVRAFMRRCREQVYQIQLAYRPGDLLAFDNRRLLHGRSAYDAAGGDRHLEGCYAERDDLLSAIRMLTRSAVNLPQ